MKWLLGKTYKIKCPDGSIRIVYRDINDALPLFVPGYSTDIGASIDFSDFNGKVDAKIEKAIKSLLINLDDLNNDLALRFRMCYIIFQKEPCKKGAFFERSVSKIFDRQDMVRTLKLKISGLIELAKTNPQDLVSFMIEYSTIVNSMNLKELPEATMARISQTIEEIKKLRGNNNEE